MTDHIALVRDARPVAHGPSPELREERRRELSAAIASATHARRRNRRRRAVALLAAATAVIAGTFLQSGSRSGGHEAWAASLMRVAEGAPRLLIGAPGWKVARADEFSADIGEMTFENGRRRAEIQWQPVSDHASTVADRSRSADVDTTAVVLGTPARIFRYAGTNDFTALWVAGSHGIELRSRASDLEAFKVIVASVRQVDVDAWLSAMPASVIKPSARAVVVRRMLADVPVPPGFDATRLEQGEAVRDRYQLGATVVSAVACAWVDRWVEAKRDRDAAAAAGAVEALKTSRTWRVLHEMDDEGAYPEVLWQHVDAIAGSGVIVAGKPLPVAQEFHSAFGCP